MNTPIFLTLFVISSIFFGALFRKSDSDKKRIKIKIIGTLFLLVISFIYFVLFNN